MSTLLTLAFVATMYADQGVLYCGGYTEEQAAPWVALPVTQYGLTWECGDLIYLRFEDGSSLMARALDAGPLAEYCVQTESGCLPIVADVPEQWAPFPGLSAKVIHWQNITESVRQWH